MLYSWVFLFQSKAVRTASDRTWIYACVNYFNKNGKQWYCSPWVPLKWSRPANVKGSAEHGWFKDAHHLPKTALQSSVIFFPLWGDVIEGCLFLTLIELKAKVYRHLVSDMAIWWKCTVCLVLGIAEYRLLHSVTSVTRLKHKKHHSSPASKKYTKCIKPRQCNSPFWLQTFCYSFTIAGSIRINEINLPLNNSS